MTLVDCRQISDKQVAFLRDGHRHVAYGGARGGGKSWAVRAKAKIMAVSYPGIKLLIVRKTYKELINNHIEVLREELHGIARYNKTDKVFLFPNGSTIWFGYCATDSDLGQYQGAEYDVVFLDEAGQLREEWIKKINACVRGTNGYPKRTYYTLNPGGPSHAYFKRLFIDKRYERGEKPENYAFIQALVTDNRALMATQPEYKDDLESLPGKLRAAWLEGRWDIFEGQFFEEFRAEPDEEACKQAGITPEEAVKSHRFTHVIDDFKRIPAGWTILRSYDFGYNKPFSCAWWAVDFDGVLYRILELYGCRAEPNEGVLWTPDEQFRRIAEIEQEHPLLKGRSITGVADPAIWDASRGESINDAALRHQVFFTKGDNRRIAGWMQVHYRMKFDKEGYAKMYICRGCRAFIRTIPTLQYDQVRVEDLDTSQEDHVADETRYLCMSRPMAPILPMEEEPIVFDPLEQVQKKKGEGKGWKI